MIEKQFLDPFGCLGSLTSIATTPTTVLLPIFDSYDIIQLILLAGTKETKLTINFYNNFINKSYMLCVRVIGLDMNGYGRIMAQCISGAKMFYCLWTCIAQVNNIY